MPWYKEKGEFFYQEQNSMEEFPYLHFKIYQDRMCLIGKIRFTATFNDEAITDEYEIIIAFPDNYPESPPIVAEIGGKTPSDYHRLTSGALCLGTLTEIFLEFRKMKRIEPFVKAFIIPYLYRYSYFKQKGKFPYDDRQHSWLGIIESYEELLRTKDIKAIPRILRFVKENKFRGHIPCPCGSGIKLRNCHGQIISELKTIPQEIIDHDLTGIEKYI